MEKKIQKILEKLRGLPLAEARSKLESPLLQRGILQMEKSKCQKQNTHIFI